MFSFNKKEPEEIRKLEHLENEIGEILNSGKEIIDGGNLLNSQFVENLNVALCKNCNGHNKNLLDLNELTQFMMKMDFVHDMVKDVNEQLLAIEGVAASSEEMSSTSMEIAQFVRDSANHAEMAMEVTNDSVNKITASSLTIQKSFQETEEAKTQIEKVHDETKKIDEMVDIIKSVADQTNLLALNASIEAARAGEAGRGFAVVADEIKKLAENTKESVEFIQNSVRSLRTEITGSVKAIELANHTFAKGMTEIKEASNAVEETYKATESIKNNMMQISESIEQQTAATEEVASNMTEISHSTDKLNKETLRTGQAFYDISKKVNGLRNTMISIADNITDEEYLDLSITDHLNWIWEVYNLGLGFNKIRENEVGDHHICRLGKWIESSGTNIPEFEKYIAQLKKPHSELHVTAKKAVKAYNSGNSHEGEQLLKELSNISEVVIEILENMKKSKKN